MSEEQTADPKPRKRRTVEEIRAWHEAEIKALEQKEKNEVHRLLAHAHDTLKQAGALKAGKTLPVAPLTSTISTWIQQLVPKS
jgi:hypothetical protein